MHKHIANNDPTFSSESVIQTMSGLYSLDYYYHGWQAMAVVNSKAHFPVNHCLDIPILYLFFSRPVIGFNELSRLIHLITLKKESKAVVRWGVLRLLRAGYIGQHEATRQYYITLAGKKVLYEFNATLEALVKEQYNRNADRLAACDAQ